MDYLLKSSALILCLYLGYVLFLKKETFFTHNRWYLLIGLVTALVLPLIVIPIEVIIEPTITSLPQTEFIATGTLVELAPENFNWTLILGYIYLTGLLIFLVQFLLQFGSLVLLLLKNSKDKDGIYTYVIVKRKISPFSFFKWIVYNPNLFSNQELQLILNHEKVHVRQWHSLDMIISRLACAVFWFNPLIWFYQKDIQQNLEYIADTNAQNTSGSKTDYQRLLLKTSIGNQNINLTSNFYNSLIKKRIIMLQKQPSKSIHRWKSLFILPIFAIFMMSFNTKEVYIERTISGTNNSSLENTPLNNTIEIAFTNKMSDEELDKIKAQLSEEGVTMTIKNIERNSDNVIVYISISFDFSTGSSSYKTDDKNGIKDFYFIKDEQSVSVGQYGETIVEILEEPLVEEATEEVMEEIIEEVEEIEEESSNLSGTLKSSKTITINDFTIDKDGNNYKIKTDSINVVVEGYATPIKSYTYYQRDTIVIGTLNTNPKIVTRGNLKIRDSVRIRGLMDTDPIYILNGKRITKKRFKSLNPNNIESLDVIKDKSALKLYGKAAKDGAIIITTNSNNKKKQEKSWKIVTGLNTVNRHTAPKESESEKDKKSPWVFEISKVEAFPVPNSTVEEAEAFMKSANKPLIIINNEVLGNIDASGLDKKIIKEIGIIRGNKAADLYGEKGKNGVVIIVTNDEYKRSEENRKKHTKNYNSKISTIGYVDEAKSEEPLSLYFISKISSDSMINKHISQLKSQGIIAKISKLKRNKAGEIVKIKVSLQDEFGNSSSATFENANGIPQVNFGKEGGTLIVSSKKF